MRAAPLHLEPPAGGVCLGQIDLGIWADELVIRPIAH